MRDDRQLVLAAANLARRAPQDWNEFLSAFRDYTDAKRDECISAPTPALEVSQGRAQACRDLFKLFGECKETAVKIEQMPRSPRKP